MGISDEYIDYSCSTPLERLSRDVETMLRSWYIIEGSDRHVSFHDSDRKLNVQMSNPSATKKFAPPSVSKNGHSYATPVKEYNRERLLTPSRSSNSKRRTNTDETSMEATTEANVASRSEKNASPSLFSPSSPMRKMVLTGTSNDDKKYNSPDRLNTSLDTSIDDLNDSSASAALKAFHTPPRTRKDLYILEEETKRSDIQLIRSGKITFATLTPDYERIEIELDLCLWDGPPAPEFYAMDTTSKTPSDDSNKTNSQRLPLSLIANANDPFPSINILNNLSSVFGIGQHLTLSPSDPSAVESSLHSTMQALSDANHPSRKETGLGFIGTIAASRRTAMDQVALQTAALKSLSHQLQIALNTAITNCDSRIPSFGIWGVYKPHVRINKVEGQNDTLTQSVMEVPDWMNSGNLFDLAADESICCSFRKHIEDMMEESESEDDDDVSIGGQSYQSNPRSPFRHRERRTPSRLTSNLSLVQRRRARNDTSSTKKRLLLPSFITGKCHAGSSCFATGAEFAIHVVPPGVEYPIHCTTLNTLGNLLSQQSKEGTRKRAKRGRRQKTNRIQQINPNDLDGVEGKVFVSGARHKYTWSKIFQYNQDFIPRQEELLLASPSSPRSRLRWDDLNIMTFDLHWRRSANSVLENGDGSLTLKQYQDACKARALLLLYRASLTAKTNKAKRTMAENRSLECLFGPTTDPLLLLNITCSWTSKEKHSSPKRTPGLKKEVVPLLALPLRIRSNNTMTSQDILEMENSLLSSIFNPLTAPDFKVSVMFDPDVACTTLSASNRCLLASLIRTCTLDQSYLLGHMTKPNILDELHHRQELDAIAEEIMNKSHISTLTRNLVRAVDWNGMATLLEMDESVNRNRMRDIVENVFKICSNNDNFPSPPVEIFTSISNDNHEFDCPFTSYLQKASKPGRLLSVLFTSMSSLQTPSAMASLWLEFISELRLKWERRESIPNIGRIPGLDKAKKQENASNGISSKAQNSAFSNSSLSDPDLDDCLLSQKLEVFNIGVECMIANELKDMEVDQIEIEAIMQQRNNQKDLPQSLQSPKDDDFFDALGNMDDSSDTLSTDIAILEKNINKDASLADGSCMRRGARCPINDSNIIATSDQIFAPYVQRDIPLTDDLIVERKNMVMKPGQDENSLRSRIDTAHYIQKPKLINDMSAFKAANPGCSFQDFILWYGNPENPLEQYEEHLFSSDYLQNGLQNSCPKTPEEASVEAFHVLNSTRTFWSDCWEEASPTPAEDQLPLFDPYSSVEMLLLWFESLHPAVLLNQILAVNISMANFILQTSCPCVNLRPVREALLRLEGKSSIALRLLNHDIIKSISNPIQKTGDMMDPFTYISPGTVEACEKVCSLIGDVEILQSRATSLLSKLNGDIELVQLIMESPEGRNIKVAMNDSRAELLNEILQQEERNAGITGNSSNLPSPSLREYILRNSDEHRPCQLTVCIGGTFGLESGGTHSTKGGLVLALKKCTK